MSKKILPRDFHSPLTAVVFIELCMLNLKLAAAVLAKFIVDNYNLRLVIYDKNNYKVGFLGAVCLYTEKHPTHGWIHESEYFTIGSFHTSETLCCELNLCTIFHSLPTAQLRRHLLIFVAVVEESGLGIWPPVEERYAHGEGSELCHHPTWSDGGSRGWVIPQ